MAKFPPLTEYLFLCPIEKLRARDLEIWRMAMEAAADVCEQLSWPGRNHSDYIQGQNDQSDKAATAIRALPEPSHD